jgi:hypothetical protein
MLGNAGGHGGAEANGMSNGRTDEDRLLDGAGPAFDPVARLVAAARAPARRYELSGEEAAAFAFRSARVTGVGPRPRHAATRGRRWAGAVGVKVAAVVFAVAAGGVAVAAGTGVLPNPIINTSTPTDPGRPSWRSAAPSSSNADRQTQMPGAGSPTGSPSPFGAEHAAPAGLCRAYQASGSEPGKSMDSAAFLALVAAAGGEDRIEAYCLAVLLQTTPGPHGTDPSPADGGGGSGSSRQPASAEYT